MKDPLLEAFEGPSNADGSGLLEIALLLLWAGALMESAGG